MLSLELLRTGVNAQRRYEVDVGKETRKMVPWPAVLSTSTCPRRRSARRLTIYRPSPVPPWPDPPTCRKSSKIASVESASMPHPVSRTSKRTLRGSRGDRLTRTSTLPVSVNLKALLTRLFRISRTFSRSVLSAGRLGSQEHEKATPCRCACAPNISSRSPSRASTRK